MAEPFQALAADEGLFARLSGKVGKGSFVRELEDVLARANRLSDVTPERVAQLAASRGVEISRRFRTARCGLYRRFLEHCLEDQMMTNAESADLAHLRGLLQLEDADVASAHEEVVDKVYGSALDHVLEDQKLDPDEEKFLRKLGSELEINADAAQRLYAEAEARARRRFLDLSVVREDSFLVGRGIALELSGSSTIGFEDAVRQALEQAKHAYPHMARAEITELSAEIEGGAVARWRVKLKGRRAPEAS